jgi:hypothetical protein
MGTAGTNVVIRHNTFSSSTNSPLFVQWQTGNVRIGSWDVEGNQFVAITRNGIQSSWGVAIENKGISGPVVVKNNTFTYGWQAGPIEAPTGSSVSGNVYTDGKTAPAEFV